MKALLLQEEVLCPFLPPLSLPPHSPTPHPTFCFTGLFNKRQGSRGSLAGAGEEGIALLTFAGQLEAHLHTFHPCRAHEWVAKHLTMPRAAPVALKGQQQAESHRKGGNNSLSPHELGLLHVITSYNPVWNFQHPSWSWDNVPEIQR